MESNIEAACGNVIADTKKHMAIMFESMQKHCRRRRDDITTRLDTVDTRIANIEKDFWEKNDTEDDQAD